MLSAGTPHWLAILLMASLLLSPAHAEGPGGPFGCAEVRLSLEGAAHSYWTSAEQGRIVLVRQCGPGESGCDHDVIVIWDWRGRQLVEVAPFLDIPGMSDGHVLDAALRSPDRLVVSAVLGAEGFRPALAEYDVPSGSLVRVVPTGSILCQDLHGGTDGILWCLGVDAERRARSEDCDLVHRFDASGTLVGSGLPDSSFPSDEFQLRGTGRAGAGGGFLAGGDATRLWLPASGELIELDDDGGIVDRRSLPALENPRRARLVSGPDDRIYAMVTLGSPEEPETWHQALVRLDPQGTSWEPTDPSTGPTPMGVTLAGADDRGLVLVDQRTLALCHLPVPGGG